MKESIQYVVATLLNVQSEHVLSYKVLTTNLKFFLVCEQKSEVKTC